VALPPGAAYNLVMSADTEQGRMYGKVAFGAWVGIVGNFTLGGAKLAGGILGRSEALTADAIDTLSDSVTSVVVLQGAWRARRPADAEHPYGHGKAEVVAARTVAVMVMLVGVLFGYRAISNILSPEPEPLPAAWTMWFAVASILVKEGMSQYKFRLGRRLKSESLIADALNHRSDVFTSLCALAGIASAVYLGPEWQVLDPIAAVAVCLIILGIGLAAFLRTGSALMDQTADADTLAAIRRAALSVDGVRDTEKLLTRRSGLETHMELHVEVDPQMPVGEAHAIATRVAETVRRDVPGAARVTVHLEPYYPDDH